MLPMKESPFSRVVTNIASSLKESRWKIPISPLHKERYTKNAPIHKSYSSSWLRRRALPLVSAMFSWAARSTMAFLFRVETLCAISALYFLHHRMTKCALQFKSQLDVSCNCSVPIYHNHWERNENEGWDDQNKDFQNLTLSLSTVYPFFTSLALGCPQQ